MPQDHAILDAFEVDALEDLIDFVEEEIDDWSPDELDDSQLALIAMRRTHISAARELLERLRPPAPPAVDEQPLLLEFLMPAGGGVLFNHHHHSR